jgi:decaprenyl-phosphate phosphoribosyltransferase
MGASTLLDRYPLLALLRPTQWIKNSFVLAALFFTPSAASAGNLARTLLATALFCAAASAVYVLNDLLDREADRLHPVKRLRPLASGQVSPAQAIRVAVLLTAFSMTGACLLNRRFALLLGGYLILQLAYCLRLKRVPIVELLVLATGFAIRVEAGGAVIGIQPTAWIMVCTGLLALFLAVAKRRDDFVQALSSDHRLSLAGYNKTFLDATLLVVLAALTSSYFVYTTDAEVMRRLGNDHLYLTSPFVIAGVLRYLQIVFVEERSGSPTRILLTDRFVVGAVLGWLSIFAVLIY